MVKEGLLSQDITSNAGQALKHEGSNRSAGSIILQGEAGCTKRHASQFTLRISRRGEVGFVLITPTLEMSLGCDMRYGFGAA
jgi:hypothetical protein